MALFGISKSKKEIAIPQPPKAPSPIQLRIELPNTSQRHNDDLGTPMPPREGPLFPDIPNLDLPELEPAETEKGLPPLGEPEKIPEHLPELEHVELPSEIPEELPDIEAESYSPRAKKNPLFVNVDVYAQMLEKLNATRAKLNEYVSATGRIEELRSRKEATMEKWRNGLEDIERKLLFVDKIIFEGGNANA
jgi:hypothetical protein